MPLTSVMPPHSRLPNPSSTGEVAGHGEHGASADEPLPSLPPPLFGLNVSGCFYAFRRHWLAAVSLGLLCGMASGATAWLLRAPRYSAVSLVRIAEKEPSLVFGGPRGNAEGDFGVYKRTQQQLLLSLPLLTSALEKPEIAQLPIVRSKRAAVTWLAGALEVKFPDGAEVLRVSLEGKNPQDLIDVVNSVVDTYREHVQGVEREERTQRLADLDRVYAEKQTESRDRRTALMNMTRQLTTAGGGDRSPELDAALRHFVELKRELFRHELETTRKQSELAAHVATVNDFSVADVADVELETFAQSDSVVIRLQRQLEEIKLREAQTSAIVKPTSIAPFAERYSRDAAVTEGLLQKRFEELREQLACSKRAAALDKVRDLRTQIGILVGLTQQLEEDLQDNQDRLQDQGKSPDDLKLAIDMEMNRAELEQLDQVLSRIAGDREKLKIESGAASRVMVVQPAQVLSGGDRQTRWFLIMLIATIGTLLPMACVVAWDVHKQFVNSSTDVSARLGLTVLGIMPNAPPSSARRGAVPGDKTAVDSPHVIECVDNMIVALLHGADCEGKRIVLVCSAVEDEGKTSVATQLASGLARFGRRTALVDFDLRSPTVSQRFDVAGEPGVADVLRGESDAMGAMQKGDVENLWLLTAGRRDNRALSALAQGGAGILFEQLRALFDFVVVLGGPIVPVPDTRLASHGADAIVFSIQRYKSRIPNVSAACKILAALGVHARHAIITTATTAAPPRRTRRQPGGLLPSQPGAGRRAAESCS